jgi:hypothetical protein
MGCAVDIKCYGLEQMISMAGILLDISDGTKRDFDELIQRSVAPPIGFTSRCVRKIIGGRSSSIADKTSYFSL